MTKGVFRDWAEVEKTLIPMLRAGKTVPEISAAIGVPIGTLRLKAARLRAVHKIEAPKRRAGVPTEIVENETPNERASYGDAPLPPNCDLARRILKGDDHGC